MAGAIAVLAGSLRGTHPFRSRPKPAPDWSVPVEKGSPDGTMLLAARVIDGRVQIEIRGAAAEILYTTQTGVPGNAWWNVEWLSDSRIRLQSNAVGELYWEQLPGGPWRFVPVGIVRAGRGSASSVPEPERIEPGPGVQSAAQAHTNPSG